MHLPSRRSTALCASALLLGLAANASIPSAAEAGRWGHGHGHGWGRGHHDRHSSGYVSFDFYSQPEPIYIEPQPVYYEQPQYIPAPAPYAPYNNAPQAGSYCREYNTTTRVNGRYQPSYGTACMQPDGSWQIQN